MSRVIANDPRDQGSVRGLVILKTPKMVLDAALLNTQHDKVRIKGKLEQSREWSSALGVAINEKGAFGSPSTQETAEYPFMAITSRSNLIWQG